MLTVEEQKIVEAVKANWDDRSVPGQLLKIIERLVRPALGPRPARSELLGRAINGGPTWLLASVTSNGKFQPNKAGCAKVGLTIDNEFNQGA